MGNQNDSNISVLLGNGDGTFQSQMTYPTGRTPSSVAAGDFNGDRKLDLSVSNYGDNSVSVLIGNGDGTFQSQKTYPTNANPTSVVTNDLNNDTKLDLISSWTHM